MKKVMVMALSVLIMLLGSIVFAQDVVVPVVEPTPVVITPTPVVTPPVVTPVTEPQIFSFPGLNISGDTGLLYKIGWCAGIGSDVLSFKQDLITLRAEILWPKNSTQDSGNVIGGGALMLDIIKAIGTKAQWKLGPIQPKIGPLVGYDFSNKRFAWGGLLQVIRAPF